MGKRIARLFVDRPTPLISVGLQRFSSDRPSPFQIDEGSPSHPERSRGSKEGESWFACCFRLRRWRW